jgi:hypothetical protein
MHIRLSILEQCRGRDKIVSEGPPARKPSVLERMYNPLHYSLRVLASGESARLIEGENAPSQKLVIEKEIVDSFRKLPRRRQ